MARGPLDRPSHAPDAEEGPLRIPGRASDEAGGSARRQRGRSAVECAASTGREAEVDHETRHLRACARLVCRPTDIAFAANGDFYVSDGYGNSRVMKYSKEGRFLRTILPMVSATALAVVGLWMVVDCLRRNQVWPFA